MDDTEWARLTNQVDRLIKAAKGLRQRSSDSISAQEIARSAEQELRGLYEQGESYIHVDNQFVSVGMRTLATKLEKPFDDWTTEFDTLKDRLNSARDTFADELEALPSATAIEAEADHTIAEEIGRLQNNPRYTKLSADYDNKKRSYAHLVTYNQGRDAKFRPQWPFVAFLVLLGVGEWYVNFETFQQRFVPFVAVVSTILVALVVAINSDEIGRYLKQYRLRDVVPDTPNPWLFRLTTIFFIIALGLVLWARGSYYWELFGLAGRGLDGRLDWGSVVRLATSVAPTIGLNLLIWFVGIVASAAFYEAVPKLREEGRERNRLRRKMTAIEDKLLGSRGEQIKKGALAERHRRDDTERKLKHRIAEAEEGIRRLDARRNGVDEDRGKERADLFRRYAQAYGEVRVDRVEKDEVSFKSISGEVKSLGEFQAYGFE